MKTWVIILIVVSAVLLLGGITITINNGSSNNKYSCGLRTGCYIDNVYGTYNSKEECENACLNINTNV